MSAGEAGAGSPEKPSASPRLPPASPRLPPASFSMLAAGIAAQVQVGLGLRPNPVNDVTAVNLDAARHGLDLLEMLEAKTKGNLDAQETALVGALLFDLRMAYVAARRNAG